MLRQDFESGSLPLGKGVAIRRAADKVNEANAKRDVALKDAETFAKQSKYFMRKAAEAEETVAKLTREQVSRTPFSVV